MESRSVSWGTYLPHVTIKSIDFESNKFCLVLLCAIKTLIDLTIKEYMVKFKSWNTTAAQNFLSIRFQWCFLILNTCKHLSVRVGITHCFKCHTNATFNNVILQKEVKLEDSHLFLVSLGLGLAILNYCFTIWWPMNVLATIHCIE